MKNRSWGTGRDFRGPRLDKITTSDLQVAVWRPKSRLAIAPGGGAGPSGRAPRTSPAGPASLAGGAAPTG
eukprot:8856040-Pyramimonas_sp.AAC.1